MVEVDENPVVTQLARLGTTDMNYNLSKDEIIKKLSEELDAAREKIRILEAKVAAFENPDEDFKMDFGTEIQSVPSTATAEEDDIPVFDT